MFEKFSEVPVYLWLFVGVALLAGGLVYLWARRKGSRNALLFIIAAATLALAALMVFAMPAFDMEDGAVPNVMYSPIFWGIVVCGVGFAVMYLAMRKVEWTARMLTVGSICVALAFVLSYMTILKMPQGGRVTPASMLPIIVFSWIYGPGPGMAAGMIYGVMQLLQEAYVVHPIQFLLDYILPFAMLGLAGFFRGKRGLTVGTVVSILARAMCHFVSGWVFFGSYAPEGQHAILYSLGYTGSYMLPELAICTVIVLMPRVSTLLQQVKQKQAALA